MGSYRKRDMDVEREIAKFLDKYLYSNPIFTKKTRTDDTESQLNGSDIILSIPSKNLHDIVVDEKAATQYINKGLPTFALELSFVVGGKVVDGWFVDDNKDTEYYEFQWIKADTNDTWNLKEKDITEVEYMLVSKQAIRDNLSQQGYSVEKLKEKAKDIREIGKDGQAEKEIGKSYWFFNSTRLAEKPINLILHKKELEKLASIHEVIKRP